MSNIGRTIHDNYCNGSFSGEYDLEGSVIIAEGADFIVIRKPDGIIDFACFQTYDYERDVSGYPTCKINIRTSPRKQELIDKWTNPDSNEN